jgi:hypothetical protein
VTTSFVDDKNSFVKLLRPFASLFHHDDFRRTWEYCLMANRLRLAVVTAFVAFLDVPTKAEPTYDIQLIGLYGAEYTAPNGSQFNSPSQVNSSGTVIGSARMYDASSQNIGSVIWMFDGTSTFPISPLGPQYFDSGGFYSIANLNMTESGKVEGVVAINNDYIGWIYDGRTTHLVGLLDSDHVNNGKHSSFIERMNEAGQATGYSTRYANGGGESSWYFDGTTSVQIGLTGPGFTYSTGSMGSRPSGINAAGKVIGRSWRYSGSNYDGDSAWYFDGTTTVEIGLLDAEHMNGSQRNNVAYEISDGGFVAGTSVRYLSGVQRGVSAWRFDGTTHVRIGIDDAAHTAGNLTKWSDVRRVNNAGQVAGRSFQYSGGSASVGTTAWIYSGGETTPIGLTGSEYSKPNGATENEPQDMDQSGLVVGFAKRFGSGGADLGESTWVHKNSITTKIGLEDADHTRDDGYRYNSFFEMNSTGFASGYAERYLPGNEDVGATPWVFNGTSTVAVGLAGSAYTRNDGYTSSSSPVLNEAGQAFGRQDRYLGGSTRLGREAWFYDPTLNQSIPLTLSMRSDGFADSQVNYLSDEGVAVGRYTLFDASDANLGDRIFYFSLEDGLHDLGALVEGGLSADGWEWLATAAGLNEAGQIIGRGRRGPNLTNTYAYFMTPTEVAENADFNDNGIVDAGDYVLWRKGLGNTYSPDHYALWRSKFGALVGGSGSGADAGVQGAAVPEPATFALAVVCGAVVTATRRRVRN